ncbi:MAG: hypothetical protein QOK10_142 [Pseudonocardiales bacterium]|jgi:uncharacterized protein (TIGR03086 family)|nr:hypothetical protein [Pseudonocardiales bacterium]
MSEVADRYRRLSAAFTDTVAAVPPDRWDAPSPCAGWDARDVLRHVVESHGQFLGLVGRSLPELPSVDEDPLAAWSGAREAVQSCLDDPALAGTEYQGKFGRSTFEQAVDGFLSFDQVVHRWDLARAAGLDERIDPEEIARITAFANRMGDVLQNSGACGPAIEPPEGADDQTRLLMALGRRP